MSLKALDNLIPEEDVVVSPQAPVSSLDKLDLIIPQEPIAPLAEPLSVEKVEPKDLSTATAIKSAQAPFITAGSLIGGAVGAPLGPPGVAVGGALGAAAGEFAFQTVEDIARMKDVEGLGESPTFSERITAGVKEGVIDLGFSAGTKAFGEAAKYVFKTRLPKETQELIKEADRLGIDPTKIAINNTKLQKFYSSIIARFPFAAGKFRTRAKEAVSQLGEAKENLFLRMGPGWDMAKIGIKLDDAFKTEYRVFRKQINKEYSNILKEAKRVGANVDTTNIKAAADDAISRMRLAMQAQGVPDDEIVSILRKDPVLDRLRKYNNIKQNLSLDELNALDELLDKDLKFAVSQGGGVVAEFGKIKDSFRQANKTIRQLIGPEEGGKTVRQMLKETDEKFTTTMTELFETPVAKKLERTVSKGLFKAGAFKKAGTKNPDESFKVLWNAKSPKGMEDLHKVVGDKRFGASLRTHIEGIWDKSVRDGFDDYLAGNNSLAFDFKGFKNRLGIGSPKSLEYKTMEKALEVSKSGVTMKDLTSFTALLENALRNSPEDVNTFIARRVTLGGRKALTGLLGSLGSVATLLISRGIGRVISGKPLIVRAGMMLDPNLSFQHRRALAVAFDKLLPEEEEQ